MDSQRIRRTPRIYIAPGEPAGIGPDLAIMLAQQPCTAELVAVADPDLLQSRAAQLGLALHIESPTTRPGEQAHRPGRLQVLPVLLERPAEPGRPDPRNAAYVLSALRIAAKACQEENCSALVTGPVQKSVINEAGFAFTGHTEFLAEITGSPEPVMMLCSPSLRVALATTHLPLQKVPGAITQPLLEHVLHVLHAGLRDHFGIADPRILVAGLNPHAGEAGYLGREEIEIIGPVIERLRSKGMQLSGPLPADTLFIPRLLHAADAVLAMYHDQGLPVLKSQGFGHIVNITLGLPIIRTSVDHGTALELAGTGHADAGSLQAAVLSAIQMCGRMPAR